MAKASQLLVAKLRENGVRVGDDWTFSRTRAGRHQLAVGAISWSIRWGQIGFVASSSTVSECLLATAFRMNQYGEIEPK